MSYASNAYNFHYGHILPRNASIAIRDVERVITCKDCEVPVVTTSRNRKRCTACANKRARLMVERRDEQKRKARKP